MPETSETLSELWEKASVRPTGWVVGRNLQRLRLARHMTQEEAAWMFREHGLAAWRATQVTDFETGRREDVTLSELYLMALALQVPMAELLIPPADIELVQLNESTRIDADALAKALGGQPPHEARWLMSPALGTAGRTGFASVAENRAARQLGISLDELRAAATRLWRHPLDVEREARLADAAKSGPARSAYRGHVTRLLLGELRADLAKRHG